MEYEPYRHPSNDDVIATDADATRNAPVCTLSVFRAIGVIRISVGHLSAPEACRLQNEVSDV